jgi:hypothetical protein
MTASLGLYLFSILKIQQTCTVHGAIILSSQSTAFLLLVFGKLFPCRNLYALSRLHFLALENTLLLLLLGHIL